MVYNNKNDPSGSIEYIINENGKIVVVNISTIKKESCCNIINSFLYHKGEQLSDESLIKYSSVFRSKDWYMEKVFSILIKRDINIEVLKKYADLIDVEKFILETKTDNEDFYKLFSSGIFNYTIRDVYDKHIKFDKLFIIDTDFFEKYLKTIFKESVSRWYDYWNYENFMKLNPHLTYENFFSKYLEIFNIDLLIKTRSDIPINIVEEHILSNIIIYSNDEYLYKISENYSSEFTKDFIIKNIVILKKGLLLNKVNLDTSSILELKDVFGIDVFKFYENNKNVFTINETKKLIEEYINMDYFINCVKRVIMESLKNRELVANRKISSDIFTTYQILLSCNCIVDNDIKKSLYLMREEIFKCESLLNECTGLSQVKISSKETKDAVSAIYLNKLYELEKSFNNIKNDICK